MFSKKLFIFLLFALFLQVSNSFAQVIRENQGDSFKWVLLTNQNTGEYGAENLQGKTLVPMGKYIIVYHDLNGGYFQLLGNGASAAYSKEGKLLIPFSRGYETIVRQEQYFGVQKNGLYGACDEDGFEIIEPKYSDLFYSSIDGFNITEGGEYVSIGISKQADGKFSGVDYSRKDPMLQAMTNDSPMPVSSSANLPSTEESIPVKDSPVQYSVSGTSDKDQYRRSSLCLILLTHRDKKYAMEMERVFKNFPLPARYNEHNISDIRVISVKGKQSKGDIDHLLKKNDIAQRVVGRWFNRNAYTGYMNMDLIHERGGYGAFYADYLRSKTNVRGTDMLRDEGIELLQSTFVLVCDMDYYDKKKGATWAAVGLAVLSVGAAAMGAVSEIQASDAISKGDYDEASRKLEAASAWNAGSALGTAATAVVADIGGFRVKMNAYLYKLSWDDGMTQKMYRDYWCDEQTPSNELQSRMKKFDNASYAFSLDYLGEYRTTSSKTILRSWSNEDEVILDVCERCVNEGMTELAKKFPIFKPRSPFYFDGTNVYSHIGSKEEVTYGKKYEIVQPYKDRHGQICYKRVGKAKAGTPWNNKNVRFDQYFDNGDKGTQFYCKKTSVDIHTPGLQLREM